MQVLDGVIKSVGRKLEHTFDQPFGPGIPDQVVKQFVHIDQQINIFLIHKGTVGRQRTDLVHGRYPVQITV